MAHPDLAAAIRLRERVMVAAVGALAAGCADSPAAKAIAPEPGPSAVVSNGPSTGAAVVSNALSTGSVVVSETPPPPSATPVEVVPPPPTPRTLPRDCYEPRSVMRSVGTGQPGKLPPPSEYDKNGCLPIKDVSNGCCNGAVSGPRFKDGACCYSFPTNAPCCGRPFTVEGQAQLAAVVAGRGWLGRAGGVPDGVADEFVVSVATRRALADGWLRDAQMEHASVASFARFVADLVGLGAPAELVREAGTALLDEVEHASLCFALASRFAGEELAPAAMPAAMVAQARSFKTIVRDAVIEGCLGETAAAYVATLRLEVARDPQVQRALERIAKDEARHAELAFRFVAWALQQRRAEVELVIHQVLAELSAQKPVCTLESEFVERTALEPMGLFAASDERAATKLALEQIARPALELLCGLASDQTAQQARPFA